MAGIKKGTLVPAKTGSSWWKHLRPFGKKQFWKSQRAAARKQQEKT
jgi:hypothetical protein